MLICVTGFSFKQQKQGLGFVPPGPQSGDPLLPQVLPERRYLSRGWCPPEAAAPLGLVSEDSSSTFLPSH